MEMTTDPIKILNNLLKEHFGIDTASNFPIWRVVWVNDQFEYRKTKYTDAGIELNYEEVRLLPKYSYIKDKYILERYEIVPNMNVEELAGAKTSYEIKWTFEDRHGFPVQPTFQGCKFVIDTIHAALGKSSMAKYIDPEKNKEEALELKRLRVDRLVEELYGDESSLELKTVIGEAVGYTTSKEFKES